MIENLESITSGLNGNGGAAPGAETRDWDAERDAWDSEEDRREMERHSRAALATAAGRHPMATIVQKPETYSADSSAHPHGSDGRFIRKGDKLEIHPNWRDEGESGHGYEAAEDEGDGRVLIRHVDNDMPIKPTQVVGTHMVRKPS